MIQDESGSHGLSMDVIRRLDDLKDMRSQLHASGADPCGFDANIVALINAYRTHQLDWNPGLVTYWTNGNQICLPRPFHYEEFL
jgi:hypothetical protein